MEAGMFFKLNPNILPKIRLINTVAILPPYVHKRRRVGEYILYIIIKGQMFLMENNKKYVLSEGDFFLLDPKYIHQGYEASFCEYYYIHFRHEDIENVSWDFGSGVEQDFLERRKDYLKSDAFAYESYDKDRCMFPKYYHFSNYNTFIEVCCLLNDAINQNENHLENYKILCSCKVLEAFIETSRSFVLTEIEKMSGGVPKSNIKVQELLTFLNTKYKNKINSQVIEDQFDCNFDYINRIFKRLTHYTIFSYLNMVRINHAKELLTTTSMKLSQVGCSVGYNDEYYFSKVFKKSTGMTPSKYAQSIPKN